MLPQRSVPVLRGLHVPASPEEPVPGRPAEARQIGGSSPATPSAETPALRPPDDKL